MCSLAPREVRGQVADLFDFFLDIVVHLGVMVMAHADTIRIHSTVNPRRKIDFYIYSCYDDKMIRIK